MRFLSFRRSAQAEDRIGAGDGAFTPDGKPDLAFTLVVRGTVTALFLASVDARGGANGVFQADTLVGKTFQPSELAVAFRGDRTAGLGVFDGVTRVNSADGALPAAALAHGEHALLLFVSAAAGAAPGNALRVYALDGNGQLVRGPTLDR